MTNNVHRDNLTGKSVNNLVELGNDNNKLEEEGIIDIGSINTKVSFIDVLKTEIYPKVFETHQNHRYTNYKSIDMQAFLADLRFSSLVLDLPDDMNHLVDLHDITWRGIVDEPALLRTNGMPKMNNPSIVH